MLSVKKIGVLVLEDEDGQIVAVVQHNEKLRKQVFYLASEAGISDLEALMTRMVGGEGKIKKNATDTD